MAFYCELPNERVCDIGWERLTCTEQWLEDQIREIRGYSREQRVQLGQSLHREIAQFCMENYSESRENAIEALVSFSIFAVGIACLGRSSATQAWKDEVAEVTHFKPEVLENMVRPFMNGEQVFYRKVVVDMAMFRASIVSRSARSICGSVSVSLVRTCRMRRRSTSSGKYIRAICSCGTAGIMRCALLE